MQNNSMLQKHKCLVVFVVLIIIFIILYNFLKGTNEYFNLEPEPSYILPIKNEIFNGYLALNKQRNQININQDTLNNLDTEIKTILNDIYSITNTIQKENKDTNTLQFY